MDFAFTNISKERNVIGDPNEISAILDARNWSDLYAQIKKQLVNIQRSRWKSGKNESEIVTKIRQYISQHLCETITLEELSNYVYLSPKYISALVKKETQYTLTEIISNERIRRAKELLCEGSFKNYEVARQVGFEDAHYFSQLFKEKTGLTPSQYRRYHEP